MPDWLAQHESVTFDPPASGWRCRPLPVAVEAVAFRGQLGLPTDRPIVMSGHQSAIWHAGIAAKVFALEAAAERFGAGSAWVVVDQDVGEAGRVAYPVRRRGADGQAPLARAAVEMLPAEPRGLVTGRQAAGRARPVELEQGVLPAAAVGLAAIAGALDRHAAAESRAMQVTRAALDLLRGSDRNPAGSARDEPRAPVLVSALALAHTDLFARFIETMRRDPAGCVARYNEAVARHPEARLRALRSSSRAGAELPLWVITAGGTREPAHEADLSAYSGVPVAGSSVLAPRALTMTAMLRWGGCDLFIHGLGGGHYDPVMEEWLATWLGGRDLARAVVVSATRLMPLVEDPPPTPELVARARWAAHHARHNPASGEAIARKREMASAIRRASGPERSRLFRAMHEWLAEQRRSRAAELAGLEGRAAEVALHADLSAIVFDRTWAFPLLPESARESLRSEVRARVVAGQG